ncbi:alkaline phosphatase-like protein, partial [Martensiomyces pterosporus]
MRFSAVVSLAALVAAASSSSVSSPPASDTPKTQDVTTKCRPKEHKKPNFVVFLTDDQDHLMDSLSYQQYVKKHFLDEGTRFTRYYTTSAVCCPSRVSMWLGTFAHNHNVTYESRPHGSYYKFQVNHLDDDWLPLWLQEAGYSNHYIGKFINGVDLNNTVAPKGWEHFESLVDPGIYNYTHPIFSLNGGPVEEHPGVYQTDLILNKNTRTKSKSEARERALALIRTQQRLIMRFSVVVSLAALVAAASSSSVGSSPASATPKTQDVATKCRPKEHKKPNFVVFLTDDQDHLMDSLSYQQYVKKHFLDEGTRFTHYYTTTAVCCPSRVSMWLGTFAHNHNVTDEHPPHGSYYKFQVNHLDDNWLPLWLQEAGYSNHYIGKFINGVDLNNTVAPKGWEHFESLVDPGIYNYTHPIFSLNGGPVEEHPGVYQTDLILNKSLARIDEVSKKDDPFLFVISPLAPHDEADLDNKQFIPPRPAERHKHLFPNAKVPRTPNFNPAKQDK